MEDASWDRMVDAIDAKFGLISHGRLKRPIADAHELTESVAFIVYDTNEEARRTNLLQKVGDDWEPLNPDALQL